MVTANEMTALLEVLGTVTTYVISQFTVLVDVVMSNALLLIPIGVILLFTTIKVFKRFF